MADDWWTDLYDPLADDTGSSRRAATLPARPVRGGGRLPDWRTGEHVELTPPAEPGPDAPGPGSDDHAPEPPSTSAAADPDAQNAVEPDDDRDEDEDEEGKDKPPPAMPPRWDPTLVAARIVQAYNDDPLPARATAAAKAAVTSTIRATTATRPRPGRLVYIASAIVAPWWVGLAPWLIDRLDGAPTGVSVALIAVGWSLHRTAATSAPPVAWCGHSLYTCCVTAAFLA